MWGTRPSLFGTSQFAIKTSADLNRFWRWTSQAGRSCCSGFSLLPTSLHPLPAPCLPVNSDLMLCFALAIIHLPAGGQQVKNLGSQLVRNYPGMTWSRYEGMILVLWPLAHTQRKGRCNLGISITYYFDPKCSIKGMGNCVQVRCVRNNSSISILRSL